MDRHMSSFPFNTGAPPAIGGTRRATFAMRLPEADWPEIDVSILEEERGGVPPFPLDLLPQPWRDWVDDTASSACAPTDYVVQAVLAALAGLCGAGAAVRITPVWSEPLVLWQAVVGESSSGKSSALASMRRLLGSIEAERRVHDDVRQEAHAERVKQAGSNDAFVQSQVVVADTALDAIANVVSGNPRGVILWRDEPTWLAQLGEAGNDGSDRARWLEAWSAGGIALKRRTDRSSLQLARFPVSILATTPPDRLKDILEEGDDGLAARFLYAWPGPQAYCPLANGKIAQDDDALRMLRRISRLARTPDDPLELFFDQRGVEALDGFLAGLHADRRGTEGLEAAWLGKGRSTVARLAGALELLAWSGTDAPGLPGHIGREQVEAAAALPAARPGRVRPRDANNFRGSRAAGGPLAEGQRGHGDLPRGHQVSGAGPDDQCGRCPAGALSSELPWFRPPRSRRRSAGTWPASAALAGQSRLGRRVKRLPEIPQIPEIQTCRFRSTDDEVRD
jgi:Protein of unknown function (DUF3987)